MANYRRLISYIYAYEGEVKGKNIGFAKLEARNGQLKLSVSVKKVYVGGSDLGVYLLAPGKEISLGRIFIRGGAGEFRTAVAMDNAADSGVSMDDCYGLTIHEPSDGWRAYTTIWEDAVARTAEVELAGVTSERLREKEDENRIHRQAEMIAAEVEREIEENGDTAGKSAEDLGTEEEKTEKLVDKAEQNGETDVPKEPSEAGGRKGSGEEGDAVQHHLHEAGERLEEGQRKIGEAGEHLKEAEAAAREEAQERAKSREGNGFLEQAGPEPGNPEEPGGAPESGGERLIQENRTDAGEGYQPSVSLAAPPAQEPDKTESVGGSPDVPGVYSASEGENQKHRPVADALHVPGAAPLAEPLADSRGFRQETAQEPLKSLRDQLLEQVRKNEERRRNGTREPIYSLNPKGLTGPAGLPFSWQPDRERALLGGQKEGKAQKQPEPAAPWRGRNTAPTVWPREQGGQERGKLENVKPAGQAEALWKGEDSVQPARESLSGGNREAPAGKPQPSLRVGAASPVRREPELAAESPSDLQTLPPKTPVIDEAQNDLILGDPQELERLEQEEKEQADPALLWETFRKRCPKIQAFDCRGGCEILTIKPQDIGLLPRETWTYGNNSFLLHGYYNYRYLILAKVEDGNTGASRYLLGVPGNYYSNEKYMASMFGFPHFVLAKRQSAPGGRFGYWYADIRLNNMNP